MGKCSYCGTTILFGGVKAGQERYCNQKCAQGGMLNAAAASIPPEIIAEQVIALHRGPCPVCRGPGPVDVHVSYLRRKIGKDIIRTVPGKGYLIASS